MIPCILVTVIVSVNVKIQPSSVGVVNCGENVRPILQLRVDTWRVALKKARPNSRTVFRKPYGGSIDDSGTKMRFAIVGSSGDVAAIRVLGEA